MGMESYGGESRPDVLNSLWPEGRDSLKYGDNHLRLVKTVVKNFYSDFTAFKTKIEGYFDSSGNAKKALDSDKLGGQNSSYYLDGANATGTLEGTKVQSSTTGRRGTVQLYNGVDSSSTAFAATAKAAKTAYDRGSEAISLAGGKTRLGKEQVINEKGSVIEVMYRVPAGCVITRVGRGLYSSFSKVYYRKIL